VVVVPDALANANEEGIKELGRLGIYLMTSNHCLTWLDGRGGGIEAA
jgi:hypothetical protein